MKELKAIVTAFRATDYSIRKAALATVVRVHGSSYRSPGARMLITDDGKWTGSISGGCLEGDALRKARQVMIDGKPLTVTYDTREESNQNLGIGLGCNGVIDVLIEPIEPSSPHNPILLFEKIISRNEPVLLATACKGKSTGCKLLMDEFKQILFNTFNQDITGLITEDLSALTNNRASRIETYTDTDVFLELIQPAISLIIFGGGFDARPVSELAKTLGWSVQITDECVAHIAPVFFPTADRLSLCQREFIERDFSITNYTACILMSHNYEYDRDVLKKLLKTKTPYIGMLGPRKRFEKMLDEFEKEGLTLNADDLHRIHSPIGLDIGAETPDEIAVSIIAEIQSKFTNRSGGFLKYRSSPIHQRDTNSDQIFKQVFLEDAQGVKPSKLKTSGR
ncbi:MAG: XdhC family protein [Flammeovirgaceae bacterium]|nr:MAG: XdhC family protein [Flammeovirgaceae bacterium]